jgi:hypothetical protein
VKISGKKKGTTMTSYKRDEAAKSVTGKSLLILIGVLGILFSVTPLYAHNLWVIGDAKKNGDGTVHLYFEHWVGPGDGAYNGPIIARGKTWIRKLQGDSTLIPMNEVVEKDTRYLVGNGGLTSGSYAIDHTSLYGIYHGQLDFFHGRYIEVKNADDLSALANSPHLPVQIVPIFTEKGILLRVMYFSLPYPKAPIWIVQADGKEENFTADNKGEFLLGPVKSGIYHVNTRIVEKEPAGAFQYEAYKGVMHGSTLTLSVDFAP